jgi:hypothetical protein
MTAPIVPALKNHYIQSFLEVPGVFKPLLDPGGSPNSETASRHTAVSEVKLPLRNRFRIKTVADL